MLSKNEYIPPGRILVVDDQHHMCWVLAKLLSERGHEVRTAGSRADALRGVSGFDCQVAVIDYRLPDSDGIALTIEIRSHFPRMRFILMTSYGSSSLRQLAAQENLFAYFDKPFNNDLMIRTIEDAVRAWEVGDDSLAEGTAARTLFPGRTVSEG